MKIEVEIDEEDLVKAWLEEIVETSKGTWEHEEDVAFWAEMEKLASRMLKLNWRVS